MLVRLQYLKKLGYPGAKSLPRITDAEMGAFRTRSNVITFRKPETDAATKVVRNVSAITRLGHLAQNSVTLHGIEADTPMAPLIVWDIAHALPVGGRLLFTGNMTQEHILDLDYYRLAFHRTDYAGTTEYLKIAGLDAEKSSLDEWTFGIPVGPDDATLLNACVKRILEFDIPKKEIILCGRPGQNFQYWDQVRIVGEDIPAPPVQISRKKNRIAQEARYENLCIIHDRVFLPANFMDAVLQFGNAYPLTTFQSIYFDDKWNLVPRRYSDFGVAKKLDAHNNLGLMRDDADTPGKFAPTVFPLVERGEFLFANPHRYSKHVFPTGSLYLCKRSVWLRCPQNDALAWAEFEDVEHAARATAMGIPSRINPHGFSQSMISRPLLSVLGAFHIETRSGQNDMYRPLLEVVPWPRKPLIKKTQAQAVADAARFATKYAPHVEPSAITASASSTRTRLAMLARVVYGAQLPIQKAPVKQFLLDFEKLIIGDQMPYSWFDNTAEAIVAQGKDALRYLFHQSPEVLNHAGMRPRRAVFAKTLHDYLPHDGFLNRAGSIVSAIVLGLQKHHAFVFPGGPLWRYRMIRATTPFAHYAEPAHTASALPETPPAEHVA